MKGKILILTDGKAGHENQSKAFARALGFDFDLVEIHFRSGFAKALSYLFDNLNICTTGLVRVTKGTLPWERGTYAAVIGTGSGTFYMAKVLARRLGVKCGVVLYPRGYRIATFDCIMVPAFDRPKAAANVIEIPANLVANDAAFYNAGEQAFRERHAAMKANASAVAVIVGGPNKCSSLTADWMKARLDEIFAANRQEGRPVEFWVTTSRRTPPDVEAVVDAYPWDYKLLYSRDHFNPIPAFVKLASRLYVTAESTGMLSEACTCGSAEVVALDNLRPGPHKFRRFVEGLVAGGYVNGNRKVDLTNEFQRAKKLIFVS